MNKKISTVMLLLYTFIEISSFLNFNVFTYLNKFNVIFSLMIFIIVFFCNITTISKKNILYLIVLLLFLLLSIVLNNGSIGSVLNIVCLIMGIIIFSSIEIPKTYYKCFIFMFIMILLFYVYKSKNILYTTMYFKNTDFNSNTVAQVILYINMFIFLVFSKYKWNTKLLYILLVPISLFGIVNTQSRGAAFKLYSLHSFICF